MRTLRRLSRICTIVPYTAWIFFEIHLRSFVARHTGDPSTRATRVGRIRAGVFHRWSKRLTRTLGVRVHQEGTPPEPPFFLVSNHLSYMDILLLGGRCRTVFVSKAEVDDWPFVGALCRSSGTLFIRRESKRDIPRVMAQMRGVLEEGLGLAIFPEGTTSEGAAVQHFKASLLQAPAEAGIPVSYATLSYRTPAGEPTAREAVCWWGDMPFSPHLWILLGLPRIDARVTFGTRPITESDRKRLAARLQEAVSADFQPSGGCESKPESIPWGDRIEGNA